MQTPADRLRPSANLAGSVTNAMSLYSHTNRHLILCPSSLGSIWQCSLMRSRGATAPHPLRSSCHVLFVSSGLQGTIVTAKQPVHSQYPEQTHSAHYPSHADSRIVRGSNYSPVHEQSRSAENPRVDPSRPALLPFTALRAQSEIAAPLCRGRFLWHESLNWLPHCKVGQSFAMTQTVFSAKDREVLRLCEVRPLCDDTLSILPRRPGQIRV